MANGSKDPGPSSPAPAPRDLEEVCRRFKDALESGQSPGAEEALGNLAEPERSAWLERLLAIQGEYKRPLGEEAPPAGAASPQASPGRTAEPVASKAPTVGGPDETETPGAQPGEPPIRVGRYRVESVLDKGAFGRIYLAHDDQLQRKVAIKVPHRHLVRSAEDVRLYLAEAQVVAGLDHPNIVPVYDVGQTEDGLCYVVSRFIEGNDLAKLIEGQRPSHHRAAELVATVAEALHHAHLHKVVHRDVKPANILLDGRGKPYLADFGLALREECMGEGRGWAGTPAYMSPEQARGESHLVDGRSDVFSLGVVFYELLTGARPFRATAVEQLLEQVKTREARPPRQIDDSIPKELERICLKALSKRASDRYTTALDMAEDLRHFLAAAQWPGGVAVQAEAPPARGGPAVGSGSAISELDSGRRLRIVPKGLRSFDAEDADFFLELLPGPRDRNGLPESIRFWKGRIEETDADRTFRVGLIYGPSGCGKSSLVKAGLLPRLGPHVVAVYVEAAAEGTEARLLRGLRRHCGQLPADLALNETVAALRRGQAAPDGKKVLIVLDQFEQWLHAKQPYENSELVEALRQCDAEHVQCIVMVRDDFAMAVTRFMRELEIPQIEGHNVAAVDLFDTRHAKRVLAAMGRAFGALPPEATRLAKEQRAFVEQAVAALAEDGKLVCVRLALLAEMIKGKPWTPSTLRHAGGMEGIGVAFLEETLGAGTGTPERRAHQKAARLVLQALLPERGSDIKGHLRSYRELLEASGYVHRPADFEALLRILDGELRLVTPSDPEGPEPVAAMQAEASQRQADPAQTQAGPTETRADPQQRHYQLTHDYLVPSLRQWLTKKQRETRRGRAELRLAEQASSWNAKPENRLLPSLLQWANIRLLTNRKDWTEPQRKMMQKAGRYHALRGLTLSVVLLILAVTGLTIRGRVIEHNKASLAASLVQRLLDANIAQVPRVIDEIEGYRTWADPLLKEECQKALKDSSRKLHASLALLPVDPGQRDYLYDRLLDAEPQEFPVIRDALAPHKEALAERLWAVVEQPAKGKESQRLRAASALATFDPNSQRWEKANRLVVEQIVAENPLHLSSWIEGFRPIKNHLLAPLGAIFRDATRQGAEQSLATNILTDYAADQAEMLADLLMDANDKQFAALYPKLEEHGDNGVRRLLAEIGKPLMTANDKETLAKRQSNAAVALLRMGEAEKVWPLLKHSPDPRVRSYLIHRFGPMGADAKVIAKRLEEEPDLTIRRTLILSLGEFGEQAFAASERESLMERLRELYRNDPDPGMHAAAEWLLRHWKQDGWLKQVEQEWAKDGKERERRLERIRQELATKKGEAKPQWYVNSQGQSMVVIPGPVEFLMGSPPGELGRSDNEIPHRQRIGWAFAIAAKAVTVEQFLRFRKDHDYQRQYTPTDDCPINGTNWYLAAEYCNWLSKEEGLQKECCYEPNQYQRYEEGMKVASDFPKRTGYRLPTEAEWEYACRAGAGTSRYYGDSEDLLGKYGWYSNNSGYKSWPVGSLKPNDFGLFDMHGNVYTWCQDDYASYVSGQGGKAIGDRGDGFALSEGIFRVMRGAGFAYLPVNLRSAYREWSRPGARAGNLGFRPARTLP